VSHFCDFDGHKNGMLGPERWGAPSSVKIGGRWFCENQADGVEAYNGLTEALRETERDEEHR